MIGNRLFSTTIVSYLSISNPSKLTNMRAQRSNCNRRFTALLVGRPYFKYGEDMRSTARKSLKKIVHQEDLHINTVINKPVVGNRLGLNLAHTIANKLNKLEKKVSSGQKKTASQKKELDELREKVLDLEKPSEGYKLVRNRFMTKFNRGYLGKFSNWDKHILLAGNIAAHQGDVKVDAMLYLSSGPGRKQRKDTNAFQALYGVQPQFISKISE